MISSGPPVLTKFVRNLCEKSCRRQHLTLQLTISTQIKFFKFIKYRPTVLNPQVRENVMQSNNYLASLKLAMLSNGISVWASKHGSLKSYLLSNGISVWASKHGSLKSYLRLER